MFLQPKTTVQLNQEAISQKLAYDDIISKR